MKTKPSSGLENRPNSPFSKPLPLIPARALRPICDSPVPDWRPISRTHVEQSQPNSLQSPDLAWDSPPLHFCETENRHAIFYSQFSKPGTTRAPRVLGCAFAAEPHVAPFRPPMEKHALFHFIRWNAFSQHAENQQLTVEHPPLIFFPYTLFPKVPVSPISFAKDDIPFKLPPDFV